MTLRLTAVVLVAAAILGTALWLAREPQGEGRGRIAVTNAWARPGAEVGGTAAVYLTIENSGEASDFLTGAETPVAESAEVHASQMEGDIMRMRRLETLEIFAGERTAFAPGGLHIMLTGVKTKLAEGDRFPLVLIFDDAGRVGTEVAVHDQGGAVGGGAMGGGNAGMAGHDPP
jgi:copper(I)-binding protein